MVRCGPVWPLPGRPLPLRGGLAASLAITVLTLMTGLRCARPGIRHPDILLITLDTFRADRIGSLTPSLARLATDGAQFLAADSPVPLTLPAHCSLLSGLLPLHHGVRNNGSGSFPAARPTIATLLSQSGYRTGAFVGSFVLDHQFGLARGFDRYDDTIDRDAGDHADSFEAERRADRVVDPALAWLRQRDAARPSFTWVHLYDAHAPYAPPAPYPQTYDGEVQWVDSQVARLLAAVDRSRTLVVVVADHGESLGEHGELTHGLLLYEPTLHVPLIVAGPHVPRGRIATPVSTVDLAPTLAALAGISFPSGADGRDLSSSIRTGREPELRPVASETQYPTTLGWSDLSALRLGGSKLIVGRYAELFELAGDPGETRNVIDGSRRSSRDLIARLEAIRKTAIAPTKNRIDDETRRKLASLGYVAPGSSASAGEGRDPRAMVVIFRRYEEALWSLHRGESRVAVSTLEQLVRDDPTNHLFRQTLGQALRQNGQTAKALVSYREAVALAPSSGDAWYNLASALQEAGESREASIAIEEAARLEPGRPEIHNIRGALAAESGRFPMAESEFRAVIASDPRNVRAWSNLGNVLRSTGHDAEAEQAYRTAIAIAPHSADALNGLGVILVQRGQSAEAIATFDAALAAAPDLYEAQLNRAIARQLGGNASGAASELNALLRRLPSGPGSDAQRNSARLLLKRIREHSTRP